MAMCNLQAPPAPVPVVPRQQFDMAWELAALATPHGDDRQ
jgi:hypothetical protein